MPILTHLLLYIYCSVCPYLTKHTAAVVGGALYNNTGEGQETARGLVLGLLGWAARQAISTSPHYSSLLASADLKEQGALTSSCVNNYGYFESV